MRSKSIKSKVMTAIGLPTAIAMVALIVSLLWHQLLHIESKLEQQGFLLSEHIAAVSEYPIISGRFQELNLQLAKILKNHPEIAAIRVYDESEVLAAVNTDEEAAKSFKRTIIQVVDSIELDNGIDSFDSTDVLEPATQKLGTVEISLSNTLYYSEYVTAIFISLFIAVIVLVVVTIIGSILSDGITKPLKNIVDAVNKIKSGQHGARVEVMKNGEIAELASNINEMAIELEKNFTEIISARDEADRSNQAKSEFLAKISHELRTPMTTIILTLETLTNIGKLNKFDAELVDSIQFSTQQLFRLFDDLLSFALIDLNQMTFIDTLFELKPSLEMAVSSFKKVASEKNLSLQVEGVIFTKMPVLGDKNRFVQLISQFVSNAIKYTSSGGVCVKYTATESIADSLNLHIEITDSGIGIDNDQIDKIFDPFTQLDEFASGAGIGLSIAKTILEHFGGEVLCKSQKGKGTTFLLNIPFKVSTTSIAFEKNNIPAKTLLLDDMEHLLNLAKEILSSIDVAVDTAASANKALSMHEQENYDLIFVDLMMPGVDGFEFAKRVIKADELNAKTQPTTLIALTGNATDDMKYKAMDAGFANFMTKPYSTQQIKEIIDKWQDLNVVNKLITNNQISK